MTKITKSKYKGIESICLCNEKLSVTFLPEQGAKICSIIDQQKDREYIYQREGSTYRCSSYAGDYLQGECAGIDDTFPNIDAFYYEEEPWKGSFLPDHGEVWSQPWEMQRKEDELIFTVVGVKMPYRLVKTAALEKNTLTIRYELENMSAFPIHYIWAAHMMLRGEENARFAFPKELSKAYTTMSTSGTIGKYGDVFTYPMIRNAEGDMYDVRVYRGEKADDYQKFYFADQIKEAIGWGEICYPAGDRFRVEFPTDEIPYIGAVQAEGGELGIRCMFLEPCSGLFDRPDLAKKHGAGSVIGAKTKKEWHLKIQVL